MGICGEYLGLIDPFLSDRSQRVLLNRQTSKWSQTKAGILQGSILEPLLFLIYIINDLPEGLTITQWGYKWKMLFIPVASKQSQEIVFYFNNMPLNRKNTQKTSRAVFRCSA